MGHRSKWSNYLILNPLPIYIWYKATIWCPGSNHPRGRLVAELLQSSVSRLNVISIEMTLGVLNETSGISLLVVLQKTFSPTWRKLPLVPVASKPTTETLLDTHQCFPEEKAATPWPWMISNALLCRIEDFTLEFILQLYRILRCTKHVQSSALLYHI